MLPLQSVNTQLGGEHLTDTSQITKKSMTLILTQACHHAKSGEILIDVMELFVMRTMSVNLDAVEPLYPLPITVACLFSETTAQEEMSPATD